MLQRVKDQYVGDINDFAKYQLLRICSPIFEEVLVAWMLTAPDGRTDGGRIQYLQESPSRELDPELFDGLSTLIDRGERRVSAVQRSGILGDCAFEPTLVPTDHNLRKIYFERLAGRTHPDSLVFLDPDNGLEIASVPKHRRGAEKYLFWDEIHLIRDTEASILIYQHFPRVKRGQFVRACLEKLCTEMGKGYVCFSVHSAQVAFLFAVQSQYADPIEDALAKRCRDSVLTSCPLKYVHLEDRYLSEVSL
jgi:hypothetical protein